MKFLKLSPYVLVYIILWMSYISYRLIELEPDRLHAYAAAFGALSGVLILAVKLLPLLHGSNDGGSSDIDSGD